jgi:hypothetical protein
LQHFPPAYADHLMLPCCCCKGACRQCSRRYERLSHGKLQQQLLKGSNSMGGRIRGWHAAAAAAAAGAPHALNMSIAGAYIVYCCLPLLRLVMPAAQ